jgi:hypothetical protein
MLQGGEVTGTRRVIFQEVDIHVDLVKQPLGDEVIAPFG